MNELALNNPLVRQELIKERLKSGEPLIAADLAQEFDISPDSIRRDLLALEEEGALRRVRGGAVPARKPPTTFAQRRRRPETNCSAVVSAALPLIKKDMSIILDGGTNIAHLAELLIPPPGLYIITPCPEIAMIMLDKNVPTQLIGGRMSPWGGVAVGSQAEASLADLSADLAFVGVCGLDAEFGLSAGQADEASLMRAIANAAMDVALICTKDKMGQRSRHRVLPINRISTLITDASPNTTQLFQDAGAEIIHV